MFRSLRKKWRRWFPSVQAPEFVSTATDFRYDLIGRMNFRREYQAYQNWLDGSEFFYVPLVRQPCIEAAAQKHAEYMARLRNLSHGHRSYNIHARIVQSGYQCRPFKDCNENISQYNGTPYGLIFQWEGHEGDWANVLNNDWVDVGVGRAEAKNGVTYWCVDFARPYVTDHVEYTDDESVLLFDMFFPQGTMKPIFDDLEGRQLLDASVVTSTLMSGVLAIVGSNNTDSIRITNPTPATVQLSVKGETPQVFASSAVTSLNITETNNNPNSIINLTKIPSVIAVGGGDNYIDSGNPATLGLANGVSTNITTGDGDNTIQVSGGVNTYNLGNGNNILLSYGTDTINAGNGNNVLYNITGTGSITAGSGQNRVITNANFTVNIGSASYAPLIFTTRTNPVTLSPNGNLNFSSTSGYSIVTVNDAGNGNIVTTFTNGTTGQTQINYFQKTSVIQIGAIFGKGSGVFINNTNIADVVYGGSAGNNYLEGGTGFNFMKSNSPNDIIVGEGSGQNILSEGGTNGTLIGGTGQNTFLGGFSGTTTVISMGTGDSIIGDIAMSIILDQKDAKLYN